MKLITFLCYCYFWLSKTKTVLICGDHVCINKAEVNNILRENLSLEVKIINQNIKKK